MWAERLLCGQNVKYERANVRYILMWTKGRNVWVSAARWETIFICKQYPPVQAIFSSIQHSFANNIHLQTISPCTSNILQHTIFICKQYSPANNILIYKQYSTIRLLKFLLVPQQISAISWYPPPRPLSQQMVANGDMWGLKSFTALIPMFYKF